MYVLARSLQFSQCVERGVGDVVGFLGGGVVEGGGD
jgi:hypothetical protein